MSSTPLAAMVTLINDKVQFSGVAGSNAPVSIDYVPPIGDGQGYTSLELFLISLASCSGTAIISLLRKMRKTVSGLKVSATGVRREEHPTYFETIHLVFELNSPDVTGEDMEKVIRISEESICPVWGMIKHSVKVTTEYRIISIQE